jgi:hypothetical protein
MFLTRPSLVTALLQPPSRQHASKGGWEIGALSFLAIAAESRHGFAARTMIFIERRSREGIKTVASPSVDLPIICNSPSAIAEPPNCSQVT